MAPAPAAWHPPAVRRLVLLVLAVAGLAAGACQRATREGTGSPAEITDRAWRAHERVIAAGERAPTCAEAGAAMQRAFVHERQAFVNAMALDRDKARLAEATAYLEANQGRYADLETRMEALSDRCAEDVTVQAAFEQMSNP